ncbi:unnamed protein product [Paramecium primaurelia]|uniref:Uncharacterized protein n=1 Tax=Paramecium primaurelia TaxID=5886 RepID=A0A8S1L4Q0_PARPR|nr:unnamed protein product [Paramecium primaurelia]
MHEEQEVEITSEQLQSMKMCKIFKDHQKDINAIDFSKDGQYLVSCDDQALNVYDVHQGKKMRTLYNKVKEIDLVRFTHHNSCVLCVTKKEPYDIYYWSLHDNQILKKFTGHTNIIHWLDLSPVSDDFLSCSMDGTLRLWNLASEYQTSDGLLDLTAKKTFCVAAFDPSGQVFAVVFLEQYYCISNNWLYLYDFKKYHSGSFQSKKINCSQVKCIKFSNNNKYILCSTGDGTILILDAYLLDTICELSDFSNQGSMIEAGFTPDCNYVISGSETGTIHIWSLPLGSQIARLDGHQKRSKVVKFCPTHFLMASGCRNLVLWIPDQFSIDTMNNNNNSRRSLMSI